MLKIFSKMAAMLFAILTVTGCMHVNSTASYHTEDSSPYSETENNEIEIDECEEDFVSWAVHFKFSSLEEFLSSYVAVREGRASFNSDATELKARAAFATFDVIHLPINIPESYQISLIYPGEKGIKIFYYIDGDSFSSFPYFSFLASYSTYEDLELWGINTPLDNYMAEWGFTEKDFIDGKYLYVERYNELFWAQGSYRFTLEIPRATHTGYGASSYSINDILRFAETVTIDLKDENNIAAWSAGDFSMFDDLLNRESDPPQSLLLTLDTPTFLHNDTEKQAPAAPFLAAGRTMVPLRIIAEALNATVDWDDATRTVTITKRNETVTLTIDTPLPRGMGTPIIVNGSTFVPIRYISETFGATVRWDEENKTVHIN